MRALVLARNEGIDLYDAELQVFGTSHAEVGKLLGEQWNFPVEFVEVIFQHHSHNLKTVAPLVLLVALADRFCIGIGLSSMGENPNKILSCAGAIELMREHLPRIGTCNLEKFITSLSGLTDEVAVAVQSIYA